MKGEDTEPRILLVDDDADTLALLALWLRKAGFAVATAASAAEALEVIETFDPTLVITDLRMRGKDGMQLLAEIHGDNPLLPVIMLSGQAQIPDAIKAMHLGSAAFLTKPIAQPELVEAVRGALRQSAAPVAASSQAFRRLICRSKPMAALLEKAQLVAATDVTVYLRGATGTGKELIAEAIHEASPRRERPFIAVNCGAIPEQLLESELFGHERGAFTGAQTRHEGLFKAADGGTLFLDEIGDMPLMLQVKLLRVLQNFAVRAVGSTRSVPVNVRIISATHRDLDVAVTAGEFRKDLFYRLKVFPLSVPALSERREDIPLLAGHFLQEFAERSQTPIRRLAPEAMELLCAASWPGNVRQLKNVLDMCATLARSGTITAALARKALEDRPEAVLSLKEARDRFEKNYLQSVLRMTDGNVADASRIAGRNRTEFYKLLKQHGIDPVRYRADSPAEH
jgi:two-component system response regulator GlrR